AFMNALKFKSKIAEARDARKLEETKNQIVTALADVRKLMEEDEQMKQTLDEERQLAQQQVQQLRRFIAGVENNKRATEELCSLQAAKAYGKRKGGEVSKGASSRRPSQDSRGSSRDSRRHSRDSRQPSREQGGNRSPSRARASKSGSRGARSRSPRKNGWLGKAQMASAALVSPRNTGKAKDGPAGRAKEKKTSPNPLDKIFTATIKQRLENATDKSAAAIFKKSLNEAEKAMQITDRILQTKRADLHTIVKLALLKHGIKTTHRVQSAKEQHERWDGEVAYLYDKLKRVTSVESFWQMRHDTWLTQIGTLFSPSVFETFVDNERFEDRDSWSQRMQDVLRDALERMREENAPPPVDVSHHIEAPPEQDEKEIQLRQGSARMAELLWRKPTAGKLEDEEEEYVFPGEVVQLPPEPEWRPPRPFSRASSKKKVRGAPNGMGFKLRLP
ncbi:unnamed protein product, partial [Effrenium voratum]